MLTTWIFWLSLFLLGYTYAGYPLLLWLAARLRGSSSAPPADELPAVTMILPVYNESANLPSKLQNIRSLDYPRQRLQVVVVSDGSTDGTAEILRRERDGQVEFVELPTRGGKAGALNAGLQAARHAIIVFSDASIMLDPGALRAIVAPFADPSVGCVSGEDRVSGGGGEALYGRYELFIRRQESVVKSIVGASGCFYAQRRDVCGVFVPNVAPDFLSVLRTVALGYRAISEPRAGGVMTAVERTGHEFERKVRTILRGMATLAGSRHVLNPFRHPVLAWLLFSHKILRWFVPVMMLSLLVSSWLLSDAHGVYRLAFWLQTAFYALAVAGLVAPQRIRHVLPAKAAAYIVLTNLAVAVASIKFMAGIRQEIWSPSERPSSGMPA